MINVMMIVMLMVFVVRITHVNACIFIKEIHVVRINNVIIHLINSHVKQLNTLTFLVLILYILTSYLLYYLCLIYDIINCINIKLKFIMLKFLNKRFSFTYPSPRKLREIVQMSLIERENPE